MILADETSVPWVPSTKALAGEKRTVRSDLSDPGAYQRHVSTHLRHAAAWSAPDGIVHITEVMVLGYSTGRITLCRAFCLNKYFLWFAFGHLLRIKPCEATVNCIGCLGEM